MKTFYYYRGTLECRRGVLGRSFGSQFFLGRSFFFTEFWVAVIPRYVLTLETAAVFIFQFLVAVFGSEFGKTARFLPEFGIVGSFGCGFGKTVCFLRSFGCEFQNLRQFWCPLFGCRKLPPKIPK